MMEYEGLWPEWPKDPAPEKSNLISFFFKRQCAKNSQTKNFGGWLMESYFIGIGERLWVAQEECCWG
jgi:hypothetical protein